MLITLIRSRWSSFTCYGFVLSLMAVTPAWASAQTLAYEPFDYPAGKHVQNQRGGEGFAGRWLGSPKFFGEDLKIVDTDLTYAGLTTSGRSAKMSRANYRGVHRALDVSPSGPFADYLTDAGMIGKDGTSLWIAFVVRGSADSTTGGRPGLKFYRHEGPDKPAKDAVSFPMMFNRGDVDDAVHLMVAHVAFNESGDRVTLYVDPDLSQAPAGGRVLEAELTTNASFNTVQIIGEYYKDPAPAIAWDELRIATSATDLGFAADLEPNGTYGGGDPE